MHTQSHTGRQQTHKQAPAFVGGGGAKPIPPSPSSMYKPGSLKIWRAKTPSVGVTWGGAAMREEQECSVLCVTVHVLCACVIGVQLLATPWTIASQAPSVRGILQARILERVAIYFFRRSSQLRDSELQVDSLPSEPPGKPLSECVCVRAGV